MAAIELYKHDGVSAGIFYCGTCRVVYADKDQAEQCHGERLCSCGNKITRGYQKHCDNCESEAWKEKERKKESERFESATKISESEYSGDMVFHGDSYFHSVEEAVDGYLEGHEPEYVWACQDRGLPKIDLEDITCNLIDNMWEDACTDDLNGVDEFETAIAAFNKSNETISVWYPDYKIAILVPDNVQES